VRADRPRAALADDVAGVARVALAEHDLPRLELARNRKFCDLLEVALHERREHGHAPEQIDNLL
jgi:hypothetical protein